jgi:predicted RNA-binding protein (virulence factor B family)
LINIGKFTNLKVRRLSDLGYMLTDDENEVLLHFKEAKEEHNVGDNIKVFIYSDKKGRPTATENMPSVTLDEPGWATIVEILNGVGCFVDINVPKDILISKDYLPYDSNLWPKVGEKVFVGLKLKHDMMLAKPLNRYDIIGLHKNIKYDEMTKVKGVVCHIAEKGIGAITVDLMYVFIPNTQLRGEHHLGEEIEITITKMLDEEYYGSLNSNKEDMIEPDKKLILDYINSHHGRIKLTAKSSAEEIESELKISRKAFKRAYGGLYKDHIIDFDDKGTFIVK